MSEVAMDNRMKKLEKQMIDFEVAITDINEIKKTLDTLKGELIGNKESGRESLFMEVKKNTEFRQRAEWTIAISVGINSLLTTGIVGIVVMSIINYLSLRS